MIECGYCGKSHRTLNAVIKCKFPYAVWIRGEGDYAVLAWCKSAGVKHSTLTISLWDTLEKAKKSKKTIDDLGCGSGCNGNHQIWRFNEKGRWVIIESNL